MSNTEESNAFAYRSSVNRSMVEFELSDHPVGFTKGLLSTLASSREAIDSFCEKQKAKIDAACAMNAQAARDEESKIEALMSTLKNLKCRRGLDSSEPHSENAGGHVLSIIREASELNKQQRIMEMDLANAHQEHRNVQKDLEAIRIEELRYRTEAEKIRNAKQLAEDAKNTTVDDLSLGVLKYNKLGLNFKRVTDDQLQFIFTLIDPNDVKRQFSFVLSANRDEMYEILECDPPLPDSNVLAHLETLNDSSDFSTFVRSMREEFKNLLNVEIE